MISTSPTTANKLWVVTHVDIQQQLDGYVTIVYHGFKLVCIYITED